jgi:hypothetical protein
MSEPMLERYQFGTAEDYHELNAGAHRKPPKVLSAPSLVWHLAFWTNFQEVDEHDRPLKNPDGSPRKRIPEEIKDAVDRYILALRNSLVTNGLAGEYPKGEDAGPEPQAEADRRAAAVQLSPCISGAYLLFGGAYDEVSFIRKCARSLRSRQRDILESSNRTVTLQFVWRKLDVTIRFEVHTENFSISTFVELDLGRTKARSSATFSSLVALNDSIASIVKYLNAEPGSAWDREETVEGINKYCFHEFWKTYQQEILSSDATLKECAADPVFKQIFADFRGFVASDQAVGFPDEEFFEQDKAATWGWDAKRKFLPLIQHRVRAEHSRYECAVNYMLDGRALYMSTLGPQVPSMPEDERIPVEFIVYAHQRFKQTTIVNKWQLGRLVSQILLLGTLRLCALKDIKALQNAGRQLALLDQSTQAARDAIASTEARADAATRNKADTAPRDRSNVPTEQTVMELIGNAHELLNKITGDFLTTGTGLSYRIERSRYYVKQFEENLKLLRIKRLEGDQPYDQFIKRRLGSEFDFIDRLGIRYERATNNVVSLDQNYLAITQNALVKQANKIDEDIHAIQEWGEFALLAALVPYYVMHLLDLIILETYVPITTLCVWTVCGGLALYRKYEKKSPGKKWIYPVVLLLVVIAALELRNFALTDYSKFLRFPETPGDQLETQKNILHTQQNLEKATDKQLQLLRELVELQRGLLNPPVPPPASDKKTPGP